MLLESYFAEYEGRFKEEITHLERKEKLVAQTLIP